jgi:hypothetical protein
MGPMSNPDEWDRSGAVAPSVIRWLLPFILAQNAESYQWRRDAQTLRAPKHFRPRARTVAARRAIRYLCEL